MLSVKIDKKLVEEVDVGFGKMQSSIKLAFPIPRNLLRQGFPILLLEVHYPTLEFSSNPNQTNLNQLINVFRITKSFQGSVLGKVGAKLWRKLDTSVLRPL